MNEILSITILIILAIVTQYLVSWAGSIISSIELEEKMYAVFTFRDDRNLPMSTNILMNICIPNVIMVFIFMVARRWNLDFVEKYLSLYIIAFFAYRCLLICVILRRKELYTWWYELGMMVAGLTLCKILQFYFFTTNDSVFISAPELKEELWIAIFVVILQFIKVIIDKHLIQNRVLTKGQISQYLIYKFRHFYGRFDCLPKITAATREQHIFLYAVMIFEDYNRGPLVRKVESWKARLTKRGTTGIMQMKASEPLSDTESVIRFYNWVGQKVKEEEIIGWEEHIIHNLAWQHNNDDDYAQSVVYIYNVLYDYIDEVPSYREQFHMRETAFSRNNLSDCIISRESESMSKSADTENLEESVWQETAAACVEPEYYEKRKTYISRRVSPESDFNQILSNLDSYTILYLDAGRYNIGNLVLRDLEHIYMYGNGAQIVDNVCDGDMISFQNCHHIVLANMGLWGGVYEGNRGNLLKIENCQEVRLESVNLCSNKDCGILAMDSSFMIRNGKIKNCHYHAVRLERTECEMHHVKVRRNVTFDSVLYGFDSNILARDITVKHNEANSYLLELRDTKFICQDVIFLRNICIEISNVDNISGIEEKQNTFVPAG